MQQITENLRWNIHMKSVCTNLNKAYFIIKTLKETMSYKMIRSIYYPYFQSRLKYGIIFWGPAKSSIMVFQIQKKVMQLIAGVNKYIFPIQNSDHALCLYLDHIMFYQTIER